MNDPSPRTGLDGFQVRWSAQTLTVCSFAGLRPCPARLTTVQVSIRQRARSGWTVDTHTHSHTHAYGNLQLRGHCTLTRQNRTDRAQLHAYTYSLFVRPSLARDRLRRTRALAVPVACGCLCWSVRRQWSGMAGGLEEPETGSENGQQSVSLTQLACHRASHTTGHYIHISH